LKIQLPSIGGLRKVVKVPGSNVAVGTTISELGSGTVSLAQLAAIISQIQAQQTNTGGGNIGDGTEAVLVPGPGLSGGGPMLGSVPLRLTAPIPWGLDDGGGGGDGDPGPPGPPGRNGATGAQGPLGPAIFMSADDGEKGDVGPPGIQGLAGATGPSGSAGAAGPPGTTLVFSNTTVPAGNTVANTSVETFFTSSYVIPPSALIAGMVVRVKLFGVYSTGVIAPTLTLRIYFGATVLVSSGAITTVAGVTNEGWSGEGLFIVQTIGATGTVEAQGLSEFSTAATAALFINMDNTASITVNTTIAQTAQVSVQWGGTVAASDTITLREMTIETMSAAGIAAPPPPPPFPVFFAEDGEEGAIGPPGGRGFTGAQGAPGVQGVQGSAVFMISDDGQDGDIGPPGMAGASGASSSSSTIPIPQTIPDMAYWFKADQINATTGIALPAMQNYCPWFGSRQPVALGAGATITNNSLNSLPALTFPGTSAGRYTFTSVPILFTAATFFAVFNPTAFSGTPAFTSGTTGSIEFRIESSGKLSLLKTFVIQIGTSTNAITTGSWLQGNAVYNSNTGAFAFRTARTANGSGTNVQNITGNNAAIGYNQQTVGEDFNGSIAELIMYNRDLLLSEITTIETYLLAKWGV
jgi:hypothetical protein